MNESELVSVILPVYNAEEFLYEAIDSIVNQTHKNLQIIIINDGSSDNSLNIINSFVDDRITVISRENKGLIYTLNEGLKIANGNYIARMDADDISAKNRIEKQLSFLKKHKKTGVVGSYVKIINKEGTRIALRKPARFNFILKATCFLGAPFIHPAVMFDRIVVGENLYYSNEYKHAEDYELWTRLAAINNIKFSTIPEYLLSYRILETSISRQNSLAQNTTRVKAQIQNLMGHKHKNTEIKDTNSLYSILFLQRNKKYIPLQLMFKLKLLIRKKTK
ncbi:glycosyltransferase [Providencia vermicola]|uniref:glycosyltransferase n=1 Tax=Providencia vermicola TaxID=333965 RepID=UPI001CEDAAE2|nr:glycosyltransferase [Providencia vermicola]